MTSQLPCDQDLSIATDLTRTLFGDQFEKVHEPWRKLFGTDAFRFQEGLAPEERAALSYQRLRLINESLDSPEQLVLDVERLTALHEWVGPVDAGLGTVASIHYNLFLGSLLDHDGDQRNLRAFTSMERTGTFLCTEAGHGNSSSQLETTATYDPVSRTFDLLTPTPAARKFMPNTSSTGGPKTAVVAARLITDDGTDRGVFLFLTPLSDALGDPLPGVRIRRLPQTATAPVDHCTTIFEHVRLPYDALLQADHGRLAPDGAFTSTIGSPRKRFLSSIGRVTTGKLCMSAYSLGVARHAVTVAVRHAHTRHTVGVTARGTVPLFAYRSHHTPLLDALATTYAATLLHRIAVQQWAQTTDVSCEDAERLAAIAKGWITWRVREVMTECRERCGAQGLFLANGITGQLAANEGTITAEGDNLVIWVKAAGELLLGHFTPSQPSDIPLRTASSLTPPSSRTSSPISNGSGTTAPAPACVQPSPATPSTGGTRPSRPPLNSSTPTLTAWPPTPCWPRPGRPAVPGPVISCTACTGCSPCAASPPRAGTSSRKGGSRPTRSGSSPTRPRRPSPLLRRTH